MGRHDQTIIEALKKSHLFSSLDGSQMDRVQQHSEIRKLDEGQLLFSQGENVNKFYLILEGKIKLFRLSPDGQEKIIELVQAGETFAEALMFMDQPHYPVNCTALTNCIVIGINAKKFKEMLGESVDTCLLLLGDMSFRLRKLVHEIDTLTLHTGTCRIAAYFLEKHPEKAQGFELDVAKSVIAARLSVKPETFSRITKNLKEQGVISINGKSVIVHDREALRSLSVV